MLSLAEWLGLAVSGTALVTLVLILKGWKWGPLVGLLQEFVWLAWAFVVEGGWTLFFAIAGYNVSGGVQ